VTAGAWKFEVIDPDRRDVQAFVADSNRDRLSFECRPELVLRFAVHPAVTFHREAVPVTYTFSNGTAYRTVWRGTQHAVETTDLAEIMVFADAGLASDTVSISAGYMRAQFQLRQLEGPMAKIFRQCGPRNAAAGERE